MILLSPLVFLSLCLLHSFLQVKARFLFSDRADKSWWGWAWGAESTVSIVDRSPTLSFVSRPAAFGEEISGPILGYVIPLSSFTAPCDDDDSLDLPSNTGCPKLCVVGEHQPDPNESWIALVQRGKCEFVNKVRESQRFGARAVVVGGEDPLVTGMPDMLVNMYSPEDSSDVKIAATYIRYSDYSELWGLIATSNTSHSGIRTLSLLITADYSAWEWYSPIITFIIILFLPSLITFITLFVHRLRAARAAQRDRAPEDVVRSLPWRVWTGTGWEKHEGIPLPTDANAVDLERGAQKSSETIPLLSSQDDIDEDGETRDASTSARHPPSIHVPWFDTQQDCAICLCEFVKGDKVRVLPCQHIFHMEEVDEWLIQRKKLCPVCKADVTTSPVSYPPDPALTSGTDADALEATEEPEVTTDANLPEPEENQAHAEESPSPTSPSHHSARDSSPSSSHASSVSHTPASALPSGANERTPLLGEGRQLSDVQ